MWHFSNIQRVTTTRILPSVRSTFAFTPVCLKKFYTLKLAPLPLGQQPWECKHLEDWLLSPCCLYSRVTLGAVRNVLHEGSLPGALKNLDKSQEGQVSRAELPQRRARPLSRTIVSASDIQKSCNCWRLQFIFPGSSPGFSLQAH